MFERHMATGYDLTQAFDNQWIVSIRDGLAYHGTLKESVIFMVNKLGFYQGDVEEGLEMLADNICSGHNTIHFGMYKSMIYTSNKEIHCERQAS